MNLVDQVNLGLLQQLADFISGSVYWKDGQGVYLGHNLSYKSRLIENKIITDDVVIIGKTDYDIFKKSVADDYRKNDHFVMENVGEYVFSESAHLGEGFSQLVISRKKQLVDLKENVIGIIGNTYDVYNLQIDDLQVNFSKQQIVTLSGLYHGLSAKEIAASIGLSPKTVESYIADMRKKCGVKSKNALMKRVVSSGAGPALRYFWDLH